MSELIARFKEGQPVSVEKYDSKGLLIGQRKTVFNDFALSLMSELESPELIYFMIQNHHLDVIEKFLENDEAANGHMKLLNIMYDILDTNIKTTNGNIKEDKKFKALLFSLIGKIDWNTYSLENLNHFLEKSLERVSKAKSNEPMEKILNTLLAKLHVFEESEKNMVKNVLTDTAKRAAKTGNQKYLRMLFEATINSASKTWVTEALVKNEPDLPVGSMVPPKNLVYFQQRMKSQVYVIEVPKNQIRIKFHDVPFDNVGHPRMLFTFKVKDGRILNMYIHAVHEKEPIDNNTPLYKYPYSNVHDDGLVCWSGYRNEEIRRSKDLEMIPLLFLNQPNNSHLGSETREMVEAYCGKEFPDEQLAPHTEKETLERFIARV
jgi:hypothetical protein